MPIEVACGECATVLKAPDVAAGRRAKCSKCGAAILVPDPSLSDSAATPVAVAETREMPSSHFSLFSLTRHDLYSVIRCGCGGSVVPPPSEGCGCGGTGRALQLTPLGETLADFLTALKAAGRL